ncbi:hypothetical protein HYT02_05810 [Candidatus Gottesmanbacteria bacterium]|nr:hypothetical protein [Candidatus Gottesmanbacteria bacterium]
MFTDRSEAGNMLGLRLGLAKTKCDYIFGITRGGIVIAQAIARILEKPLFPLVVKKVSLPGNPELALGAVTYDKVRVSEDDLINRFHLQDKEVSQLFNLKYSQVIELKNRLGVGKLPSLTNKNIIVTDDGVATGATVRAAGLYLVKKKVKTLHLAVPVIARETYLQLSSLYNKITALKITDQFFAVGQFYKSFPQVDENEIIRILKI